MNDMILAGDGFDNRGCEVPMDEDSKEDIVIPGVGNDSPEKDDASAHNIFELLSRMKEIASDLDDDSDDEADDDSDDENDEMDANKIHNKSVDYARHGKRRAAAELCINGLKRFPLNVDLLADTIKYSSDTGDMETAHQYYSVLSKDVPHQRWNWRAFTFSFDYLLKEDPLSNESACRAVIANYKRYLPFEEKANMAESELESALGNDERSMEVLKEAIAAHANASQCALRLADMQMERGLYAEALATANYGIAASAEPQPSINVPYMLFVRALAKDNALHMKEYRGEPVTSEELETLEKEYDFLSGLPELFLYLNTIQMRLKMLKIVKTN